MDLQQFLADRVVLLRHRAGLTQVKLAEQIGITQVGLSLIENGHSWPKADTLAKLASALGITAVELFQNNSRKTSK